MRAALKIWVSAAQSPMHAENSAIDAIVEDTILGEIEAIDY